VGTVLLEVISEKTGYPVEMLELDMALDADLGIDSIKRVEILAALQERLPEAPAIKPEHLGTLHTLRHIVAFLAETASPGRAGGVSPLLEEKQEIDAPRSPEQSDTPRTPIPTVDRSVLQAIPLSVPPRASVGLPAGAEVWIAGEAELAAALEGRLHACGLRARRLSWDELMVGKQPALLGGLVLLAPAEQPTDALLRQALLGVQHAGAGLRAAGKQGGAVLATVSRLDGAFGLSRIDPHREPVDGGLAGLVKTAAHEWPEVSCKALDLASDFPSTDEAAATLAEELFLAGPVEVGLSRGGRRSLECVAAPLPAADGQPFAAGDVIVLSGGARGVTAAVAEALARVFQPTLILLGRSPEPQPEPDWLAPLSSEADIKREIGLRANGNTSLRWVGEQYQKVAAQREVRQTLARLHEAGARAVYRSVDVRDAQAVAAVLAEIRRDLGPVRALVHGAGVLADARIEDKTVEQLHRVYGTKVGGLRSLLAAVDPDELRALVLFSSSTGRCGRTGQVDYAIANEVLNKTAQQLARRLPRCRTVAVNWGPWDGGMVTPGLKKVFAEEGIGLIDLQAGADYLVNELRAKSNSAAEVVILAAGSTPPALPAPAPVATVASTKTVLTPAFERVLDLAEYPVLESHVLDGRPVLPVVLILEWLAHGALHHNPGLLFHGCNELRVLHGVILDGAAPTLHVVAGKAIKQDGFYVTAAELRGVRGDGREVLHARAEIVLASQLPHAPAPQALPALKPYTVSLKEVYQDRLFHGPMLHGIERVEGCGEQGIAAHLRNAPAPATWLRRPLRQQWITDPLVLDASFQLMVLWCLEQHGAPSLPCLLQRYRQYRRSFPAGGVQAVATLTRASGMHALADIDYRDSLGQVVARLEGYECVIDPALRRAFRRRTRVAAAMP
jgi:NAD(P)-dependent dehydrogenase (short-subunit alcohol dehydrogenase family)